MLSSLADFVPPDDARPLDLAAALDATPADATLPGLFLGELVRGARSRGVDFEVPRVGPFTPVSMRTFMQLSHDCARALFPDAPARGALRSLGRLVFPVFRETLVGRPLFATVGRDLPLVLRLGAPSYRLVTSHGGAELIDLGAHHAVLRLHAMHSFLSSYHVGIGEGVLEACGVGGRALVRLRSEIDGDIALVWGEALAP